MGLGHSPRIVTDNLLLCLDAGNTKSYPGTGTAWKDLTGSYDSISLQNGPTYSTDNGGYFDFDGTDDYVGFPQINFAGTEITAAIWAYGVNNNVSSTIYFNNSDGYRELNVHLPWSNNNVYFDKAGGSDNNYDRINKAVTNAEYQGWHHWVFTANSSTGSMKIYHDGDLWHSGTGKTRAIANADGGWKVLATNPEGNDWTGYISIFQLYKNELSAAEVKQNYNAHKGRFE